MEKQNFSNRKKMEKCVNQLTIEFFVSNVQCCVFMLKQGSYRTWKTWKTLKIDSIWLKSGKTWNSQGYLF